jgi:hypothetical protein
MGMHVDVAESGSYAYIAIDFIFLVLVDISNQSAPFL